MTPDVTLVITACNRPQYLARTLDSFVRHNTYPLARAVIVEDSGLAGINDFARSRLRCDVDLVYNARNVGQMESIDRAYARVDTRYVFHCEEDWEFVRPGFVEASKAVLDAEPRVVCVWLRGIDDTNGHPVEPSGHPGYAYLARGYRGVWHGFTLNPGLRRLADYKLLAPFADLAPVARIAVTTRRFVEGAALPVRRRRAPSVPDARAAHWSVHLRRLLEEDLSEYYARLGFRAAILTAPSGYVRHIGVDSTRSLRRRLGFTGSR
jgi:hypothetical protein